MEANTTICSMAYKMEFTLALTTPANMPSANKNSNVEYKSADHWPYQLQRSD